VYWHSHHLSSQWYICQDIEVIDITGSGDNTLKLNLDDLLDASTSLSYV
jgi:hypothetical protein